MHELQLSELPPKKRNKKPIIIKLLKLFGLKLSNDVGVQKCGLTQPWWDNMERIRYINTYTQLSINARRTHVSLKCRKFTKPCTV